MKLIEPWMPERFTVLGDSRRLFEGKEQEDRIEGVCFRGVNEDERDLSRLCLSKVRFENCTFFGSSFEKGEFTDLIFENCNFSGCNFSDSYFNRCAFLSCKGVGATFYGSSIQNLTMDLCSMNYANFDSSKLTKVRICSTELGESNFAQCRMKEIVWEQVVLRQASFFKTPLKGMDFTTSDIGGWVLSDECWELKGAVVDANQAVELAKRLGIVVK